MLKGTNNKPREIIVLPYNQIDKNLFNNTTPYYRT